MKMRILNYTLLFGFLLINVAASSQSNIVNYEFKEGEILDVLLLQQHPDTEEELKAYFGIAFPIATRMSYTPLPGFRIKGITQGNHMPSSLIFGKWDDVEIRTSFLNDILEEVPDFHQRRRTIWSYFGLTYYELEEDLSYQIDKDRYNVVTTYWRKPGKSLDEFNRKFERLAEETSGEVILTLKEGTSPFGYYYQPDLFIITSWDSEEDFNVFYEENIKLPHEEILHVNQFILF